MGFLLPRGFLLVTYFVIYSNVIQLFVKSPALLSDNQDNNRPEGDYLNSSLAGEHFRQSNCQGKKKHQWISWQWKTLATFPNVSATSHASVNLDVISSSVLQKTTFLICNGLALVDVLLSRMIRLQSYWLELFHRIAECNLKWAALWFAWLLLSPLGPLAVDDYIQTTISLIWNKLNLSPITFVSGFVLYAVVVNWTCERSQRILCRLCPWWVLITKCLSSETRLNTDNTEVDWEINGTEFTIPRLALPNLWLSPQIPRDYTKYLPTWQQKENSCTCGDNCAICLAPYKLHCVICDLPCGHRYHRDCIMPWFQTDNHLCPMCRWPAYQSKF